MAEPFVGEIRLFTWNWAPKGWAQCDGQIMNVQQNLALFSLIGNYFGGSPSTTFALPEMRGRAPICVGRGASQYAPFSSYTLGNKGGAENVTLAAANMPAHFHVMQGVAGAGTKANPVNHFFAGTTTPSVVNAYASKGTTSSPTAALAPAALTTAGNGQGHNNMQPFLAVNFCIALSGVYPPRN